MTDNLNERREINLELISIVNAHTQPEIKVGHNNSYTPTSALLRVMHGKITYFIDGQLVDLHQGELLYMSANTLRSAESDCTNAFHRITLLFNEKPETDDLAVLFQHRNKAIKSLRYEYMKQRLSQANQIWIDKSPYYEMICHGIVSEIFGTLQQELLSSTSQSVTRNIVAQVKQFMLNHYRENVHVTDLAKHVSRTPNYVTAIFKAETGKTPKQYLN